MARKLESTGASGNQASRITVNDGFDPETLRTLIDLPGDHWRIRRLLAIACRIL